MIILPYGHENQQVRRLPWVTFGIMALCLLIHFIVDRNIDRINRALLVEIRELISYYIQHPYLKMDSDLENIFFPNEESRRTLNAYKMIDTGVYLDEEVKRRRQSTFNRMMENVRKIINETPYMKYGYIPARGRDKGLFSYMFLHGDWWHLIGNMLFLYLLGPFIEDIWGRLAYAPFYILGGMFSAFMYGIHYPDSSGPLIGASGAVAAAMGAFLIRYYKTRIKFVFISIFASMKFKAPAWLMLPLWLVMEFLNARTMDNLKDLGYSGGGVAHWAHVWGFVFGMMAAFLLRYLKYEEKYVNPLVEAASSFVKKSYSLYEEAVVLQAEGKRDEAFAKMMESARLDPTDPEVMDALWGAAIDLQRLPEVIPLYKRLIETDIRRNDMRSACDRLSRLISQAPGENISHHGQLILVEYLAQTGDVQDARDLFERTPHEINSATPAGKLIQYAGIALKLDVDMAKRVLDLIKDHPDIPSEKKELLAEQYREAVQHARRTAGITASSLDFRAMESPEAGFSGREAVTPAERKPAVERESTMGAPSPEIAPLTLDFSNQYGGDLAAEQPHLSVPSTVKAGGSRPPLENSARRPQPLSPAETQPQPVAPSSPKALQVLPVIPLGMSEDRLLLRTETMGDRNLPYTAIKALSAAQIAPEGEARRLVIDLWLDDPASPLTSLRVMRATSRHFDPRRFFPESASLLEAYQRFLWKILQLSGARPMPNRDAAILRPGRGFVSLADYEKKTIMGR